MSVAQPPLMAAFVQAKNNNDADALLACFARLMRWKLTKEHFAAAIERAQSEAERKALREKPGRLD